MEKIALAIVGGCTLCTLGIVAFDRHSKLMRSEEFLRQALDPTRASRRTQIFQGRAFSVGEEGLNGIFSGKPCLSFVARKYRLTEDQIKTRKRRREGNDSGEIESLHFIKGKELLEEFSESEELLRIETESRGRFFVDIHKHKLHEEPFVEMVQSLSRFEESHAGNRRTVGIQIIEEIVPNGQHVFLLGNFSEERIVPSDDPNAPFFLSTKSPNEIAELLKVARTGTLFMSALLIGIGTTSVVFGIVKSMKF